jgi:hypothetical protein
MPTTPSALQCDCALYRPPNGAHRSKYTTLPQTTAHPSARTYWYTPSVCYWYTSSVWMMRTSSSLRMSATPHTVSIASTCHITQLGRLITTLCDYYTSKISSQRALCCAADTACISWALNELARKQLIRP